MPSDDALGICDAMNAAIQEYYSEVPTAYKGTTFEGMFEPGFQVSATFTNGSNLFTGWAATPLQKGYTIVAGTDTRQNVIVGPGEMLHPYIGIPGVQNAMVYGDVLQMDQIIERFTSDPVLVDVNRVLVRDENWRRMGSRGWGQGATEFFPLGTANYRRIGCPIRYWIERQGESQNGNPPFMLRIDALPDIQYRVTVEGLLAPIQTVLADLTVPVQLPLDNFIVESMVLPMAVYHMTEHPLWADNKNFARVAEKYQKAIKLTKGRAPDQGSSANKCGTPRRY